MELKEILLEALEEYHLRQGIKEGLKASNIQAINFNKNHDKYGRFCSGLKGQAAVMYMLKTKKGSIKNVFYRKEIGHIDLICGDGSKGLSHIVKRRKKDENKDIYDFISDLTEVIEKGKLSENLNKKGRWEISLNGKVAVIEPKITNNERTFLLTAYSQRQK